MIYAYKDLKGVIKVGDIVRAVPGKPNACDKLEDDGSNTAKILVVADHGFKINNCWHPFCNNSYLEIVTTPLWEHLKVGDTIVHPDGEEAEVLEVGASGKTFLRSDWIDKTIARQWYTLAEAKKHGWTLKGADETPLTVTHAEVEAKFGRKVIIKD